MRVFVSAFLLFVVACMPAPAQSVPAQDLRFAVGSGERRAVVVNQAPAGQLRPAVLVLHGGRGSADQQRERTGFDAVAQREGFTVVYPEGTALGIGGHAWNTGYLLRKQVGEADDVAYFDTLIDLLVRQHRVDPKRVYMTGGSNGAMMTFVYAVKRTEKLAAIVPIVGAMFTFDEKPTAPIVRRIRPPLVRCLATRRDRDRCAATPRRRRADRAIRTRLCGSAQQVRS